MKGKIDVKIKGRMLVRDKHGRPSFNDPSKVKNYWDQLTDEDKDYLVQFFNVSKFEDFLEE